MTEADYVRGLSDGFALALAAVRDARDIDDVIERIEAMRELALEGAIEQLLKRRKAEVVRT